MKIAFKEWAVVVDALGHGRQTVILRKGGIAEGKGGFRPEHPEFLLFPTLFHQQREQVIDPARQRYDEIAPTLPGPHRVRIEYFARVADCRLLASLADAEKLRDQHIWRNEVIRERFDWGRQKNIHALAVRVFRLAQPQELPVLESYGGCKSWIELEVEIPLEGAAPVIGDAEFEERLARFRDALAADRAA